MTYILHLHTRVYNTFKVVKISNAFIKEFRRFINCTDERCVLPSTDSHYTRYRQFAHSDQGLCYKSGDPTWFSILPEDELEKEVGLTGQPGFFSV